MKNKSLNLYADKGIELSNQKIRTGDVLTLTYSGLLAASGADRVFIHYGYGDSWDELKTEEMINDNGRFTARIELKKAGSLNVCFKDSANNWDNNSNENYCFKVSARRTVRKSGKEAVVR